MSASITQACTNMSNLTDEAYSNSCYGVTKAITTPSMAVEGILGKLNYMESKKQNAVSCSHPKAVCGNDMDSISLQNLDIPVSYPSLCTMTTKQSSSLEAI